MRRAALFVPLIALAAPGAGKDRAPAGFAATPPAAPTGAPPADGAIFHGEGGYAALIEGHRARRVGDPVTIVLAEATSTAKTAAAKTQKGGTAAITPPATGLLAFLNPVAALNTGSAASFNGTGNATQTSSLAGTIAVTIAETRANGTALVKGQKLMTLSQGREWVQFSGIVRLADLDEQNRIVSTRVADARIEYAGSGAIQRASRPGWLARFFGTISPF